MRFLMINLLLICLLLFGIGYLAFGNTEPISKPEMGTDVSIRQFVVGEMQRNLIISTHFWGSPLKEIN